MAYNAGSPALRVPSIPDSERETTVPSVKDRSGDPLLRWLVAISFGCLLMALVCAVVLSRFVSVPITTSSAAPVNQEIELRPDVSTIDEIEGRGSLQRFGPAFAP